MDMLGSGRKSQDPVSWGEERSDDRGGLELREEDDRVNASNWLVLTWR